MIHNKKIGKYLIMRVDVHSPRKLVLLILNFCGLFESKKYKNA